MKRKPKECLRWSNRTNVWVRQPKAENSYPRASYEADINHCGLKWSMLEGGNGFEPLSAQLHGLSIDELSEIEDAYSDARIAIRQDQVKKYRATVANRAVGLGLSKEGIPRGFFHPEGIWRYEFFKAHDPYFVSMA